MSDSQHQSGGPDQDGMSREQIRAVFIEHRGEAKRLAEQCGVSETVVSGVLQGKTTSRRVLRAARARAVELLAGAVEAA